MRRVAAVLVSLAPCAAVPASDVPRIVVAGASRLPAEALAADGTSAPITGISGVTWLGADRWAAVADTGAVLVEFSLEMAADGEPRAVRDVRAIRLGARHDYEDVATCPGDVARRCGADGRCLVVCEEDTPALHVVDAAGAIVGGIPLPALLAARRPNRGPESLCLSGDGRRLWTANEEALPDDGPPPASHVGTVVRLVEVPLDAANAARGRQCAYAVDPPHACVGSGPGEVYSGVVALASLADGRLLVLERSAARCLPPFENRLYLVDPASAVNVADIAEDLADRPDAWVAKRLAWRGSAGCNLEGIAVGPPLAGGGTALVAVADAGGLDAPNQLVVLRMDGPVTSP